MASLRNLAAIAKKLGSSVDEARAIVSRYGDDVVKLIDARKSGDSRTAYEIGRNAGSFGKSVDTAQDALLRMRDLGMNRAYAGRVNPDDLLDLPEFDDYFNTYRAIAFDPKTGGLRKGRQITRSAEKGGGLADKFREMADPNIGTERILGVEPFRTTNVTGELIEAAGANDKKRFANAMAQRVSNHMALLSRLDMDAAEAAGRYGLTQSSFYGPAADLHGFISDITGIPRQMISSAMAVASAGSSPYDELLKLTAAMPYIKMGPSGVMFDDAAAFADGIIKAGSKGTYSSDPVYKVAKSLESVMNGNDPLVDDLSGLALKTYQYRNMMAVPDLQNISVSDRIAQRLASGSISGVAESQGDILAASPDWVGDQAIGAAENVTAAVPQEGAWFAQRVSEMLKGGRGVKNRTQVGQGYPISADEVEAMGRGQFVPGLSERIVEGRRIGGNYKPPPAGRVLDPQAVAYAQQFAGRGMPTTGMPLTDLALPPSMRTPENVDITQSGLLLARAMRPVIDQLKTPRSYAMALLAGTGALGFNALPARQQPVAQDPLRNLAQQRITMGTPGGML